LDQNEAEMFRNRNKWRDLLKKQVGEICQELKMSDVEKTAHVDPNFLMKVITKRV